MPRTDGQHNDSESSGCPLKNVGGTADLKLNMLSDILYEEYTGRLGGAESGKEILAIWATVVQEVKKSFSKQKVASSIPC